MDNLEEEDDSLKNLFLAATEFLPQIISKLDDKKLLNFYGLYKQATVGTCNISRPGWYAFERIKKWEAWNSLGKLPQEEAMRKYISLLNEVSPDWQDERCEGGYKLNGVSVSRMKKEENDDHSGYDVFDFVKEGCLNEVQQCLKQQESSSLVDEDGMNLLHWAADRGNLEMVRILLDHGFDKDATDSNGQTPLHYACSCEHLEVARLLLERGCDTEVVSSEGFTPLDLADGELKILLSQ